MLVNMLKSFLVATAVIIIIGIVCHLFKIKNV